MMDNNELTPLIKVLADLRKQGYTHDFIVTPEGQMGTMDGDVKLSPEQVRIVDFYRFEGESNPGDMAILYVLETETGLKGTITDAYGTYADEDVEGFMKQVTDLGKDLDTNS